MTPLIQIVGPAANAKRDFTLDTVKTRISHIADVVADRPFYLDLLRLPPGRMLTDRRGSRIAALEAVYGAAIKHHLSFVPVLDPQGPSTQTGVAVRTALATEHGCALRVRATQLFPPPGHTYASYLAAKVDDFGLEAGDCDLLLDFGYIGDDDEVDPEWTAKLVAECCRRSDWRSVVLIGTSIPKSLTSVGIGEDTSGTIPRREWTHWIDASRLGAPNLAFGDYAIQHPEPPPKTTKSPVWANVRYTGPTGVLIERGFDVMSPDHGRLKQYDELCQRLVEVDEFEGGDFSWGDRAILRCANGAALGRSLSDWRAYGTSHHLELVRRQLEDGLF